MGISYRDDGRQKKTDFAIKLQYLVEAGNDTGYTCIVKRFQDMEERFVRLSR